ncbi:MAG: DMT family transporter [Candidatus Aenigmarchaeota archaeon]|nr:DMT family transporter [Candidatus Aenigmarchaeota archaeon]MDW8149221.1 DMT family transporter [Candidatus Aenigmarchaeota archaeon]
MHLKTPILPAALSGILWGTVGFFVRSLRNLPSLEIAWFRFFFGIIFLMIIFPILREKIKAKNKKILFLNGLIISFWYPFYITSINFGAGIGEAAFLLSSAYVFSVVFSAIILKETIDKKTAFVLSLVVIGNIMILKPFELFQNFAEVLALICGMAYGLNLVILRKSQKIHNSFTTVFYQFLVPSILLLPFSFTTFKLPNLNELLYLISFSLIATVFPIILFVRSLKYLKTFEAGIPALLEPISASIIGWLVFSEIMDIFSILGAILIILANLYYLFIKNDNK